MEYSHYGQGNPDGIKFCGECGTLLKKLCPQCEFEDPQSAFHNPQLEAEQCFLKAIEVAQRQQAKSLELRATMSLLRLRQQQTTQQGSRNTNPQPVPYSIQHATCCLGFTTGSLEVLIRQTSKMRRSCWQSLEIPEDKDRARGSREGERNNET